MVSSATWIASCFIFRSLILLELILAYAVMIRSNLVFSQMANQLYQKHLNRFLPQVFGYQYTKCLHILYLALFLYLLLYSNDLCISSWISTTLFRLQRFLVYIIIYRSSHPRPCLALEKEKNMIVFPLSESNSTMSVFQQLSKYNN